MHKAISNVSRQCPKATRKKIRSAHPNYIGRKGKRGEKKFPWKSLGMFHHYCLFVLTNYTLILSPGRIDRSNFCRAKSTLFTNCGEMWITKVHVFLARSVTLASKIESRKNGDHLINLLS